jgi:membrane-bound ClpP family serine protease
MKERPSWRERLSKFWLYLVIILFLLLLAYVPLVKALLRSIPLLVLGGALLLLILLGPLTKGKRDSGPKVSR